MHTPRIGIIDWGIGGISIYRLVKERLGDIPVVYLSDTGVTPYGKMQRGELVARLNAAIRQLSSHGVTHLAIGCNAASTAIPFLDPAGLVIEGVIDSAVTMTVRMEPKRLGLIGGRRTVVSGVYRRAFSGHGIDVRQRIAQPLSGLIESGDTTSDTLRAECRRILGPLKHCSHILLACTHYPAITPVMREMVSPQTVFIDPAAEMTKRIKAWTPGYGGEDIFLTTGDKTAMRAAARKAFGVKLTGIRHVAF